MMKTILFSTLLIILSSNLNGSTSPSDLLIRAKNKMTVQLNKVMHKQGHLQKEINKSIESFSEGVMQMANSIADLISNTIAYSFITIGNIFTSVSLKQS